MKKILLVISICFFGAAGAFADVLGPPAAGLKKGHWSAGAEYFFGKADIKISDSSLVGNSTTLKDWESSRIYGVLGYGLSDDWEVFVRLGSADTKIDDLHFSSGYQFAGGLGTKYTFLPDQTLPWGALFQISWLKAEDSDITVGAPGSEITGDVEINWNEIKIAVGPTYNYSDKMRFYGGLGAFLFDGEVEASDGINKIKVDTEEKTSFGGYIGAQMNLYDNTVVNIEGQFTSNSWGIGAGIIWKL
jgi:opacity protein-like surface antigen